MNRQALRDVLNAGHPGTGPYDADPDVALKQLYEENVEEDESVSNFPDWITSGGRLSKIETGSISGSAQAKSVCGYVLILLKLGEALPAWLVAKLLNVGTINSADRAAYFHRPLTSIVRLHRLGNVQSGNIIQAREL